GTTYKNTLTVLPTEHSIEREPDHGEFLPLYKISCLRSQTCSAGDTSIECEPDHSQSVPPAVERHPSRDRKHVPKEGEMDILSATFGSAGAAETCVGALVFLLIYLAGFVLFQNWSRISMPTPVVHRHIISGLSAALAAVGV